VKFADFHAERGCPKEYRMNRADREGAIISELNLRTYHKPESPLIQMFRILDRGGSTEWVSCPHLTQTWKKFPLH